MSTGRPLLTALCLALALSSSCKTHADGVQPAASATASAVQLLASARPVAAQPPWFLGGFSGQYEAKVAPVGIKAGAVREWSKDDGKLSSGPGKLTLQIDGEGNVQGVSEGALGEGSARGKVEDDTLRVQLTPNDATGLHGVLVASRAGDGFTGTIQASSSDSLQVRTATIELKKQLN